jgi:hypothetical protein
VERGLRYFGAAMAFGSAAVWILASLTAALVCLSAATLGYGAVLAAERMRANLSRARKSGTSTPSKREPRTPKPEEDVLPLVAEELNHDLGYVYEPTAPTPPRTVEPEYGWPSNDDTAAPNEAPYVNTPPPSSRRT